MKSLLLLFIFNYRISFISMVMVFLFPLDGMMKDFDERLSPDLQIRVPL